MAITTVTGRASGITRGSDYSYAASANNGPIAIKNQMLTLRLGTSPVTFKSRVLASIDEGDHVAAAGSNKNGTMEAVALRNLTTGASYHPPTVMPMVLAALLIALGVPLIAFLGIGLLFIGMGAWVLYKCLQVRKAAGLLAVLSVPPQATATQR